MCFPPYRPRPFVARTGGSLPTVESSCKVLFHWCGVCGTGPTVTEKDGESRQIRLARQLGIALQPRHDQPQQREAELRILEVQLLELLVGDRRRMHLGLAADRHGAPVARREQPHLADQRPWAGSLLNLHELYLAGHDIEGLGRNV